jgi:hypothetical protein
MMALLSWERFVHIASSFSYIEEENCRCELENW